MQMSLEHYIIKYIIIITKLLMYPCFLFGANEVASDYKTESLSHVHIHYKPDHSLMDNHHSVLVVSSLSFMG